MCLLISYILNSVTKILGSNLSLLSVTSKRWISLATLALWSFYPCSEYDVFLIAPYLQCLQVTRPVSLQPCVLSRFSRVRPFVTLWIIALQASLSMGFSRREYWRGLPCPPSEDLPDPGIEPASLPSPAMADGLFTWETLSSLS